MTGSITRRTAVTGTLAVAAGGTLAAGCRDAGAVREEILTRIATPLPADPGATDLVRFAVLAASGHNTQPWLFEVDGSRILIRPDPTRRTPVVDPDDHHLFASLGAAAENLSIAAAARGRDGAVSVRTDGQDPHVAVDIAAVDAAPRDGRLLAAIPLRQCTRSVYDGSAVDPATADRLVAAADAAGVDAVWIDGGSRKDDLLSLILAANTTQVEDPAFRHELKRWLRFNAAAAIATRDGLYTASSGAPTLPDPVGGLLFGFFFNAKAENRRYAEAVRSSAGLLVLVPRATGAAGAVAAGRAYQRLALEATVAGLRHAFVNQPVEVPAARAELGRLLSLGDRRPALLLRVGRAPAMPRSLRRPVADVLA